jgi:hypothetical protein
MQEENIIFTTERGHTVVLRPYITGLQKQSIADAFIDAAQMNGYDENGKAKPVLPSEQMNRATRRAFEVAVVSVDGATENVADAILALPHRDTAEVKAKIDEITDNKKKAQSTPTN